MALVAPVAVGVVVEAVVGVGEVMGMAVVAVAPVAVAAAVAAAVAIMVVEMATAVAVVANVPTRCGGSDGTTLTRPLSFRMSFLAPKNCAD